MVVKPPTGLLESLAKVLEESRRLRQELSGKPERDQGRRVRETRGSGTADQASP